MIGIILINSNNISILILILYNFYKQTPFLLLPLVVYDIPHVLGFEFCVLLDSNEQQEEHIAYSMTAISLGDELCLNPNLA